MKTQKMNFRNIMLFVSILGLGFFASSCEENGDLDLNTLSVELDDELYTADVFDEIAEIGDEAIDLFESNESDLKSGGFMYTRLSECVTVTKVITDSIITTTIDFGEVNCLCNDERERRGKIIMTHEGRYWDGGVYITYTFEDFFVDDNQITGDKTVTQTINIDENRERVISIAGSIILADGTGTITYQSDKVRTIVVGSDTRTRFDDVIETTGNSNCTLADDTEITMTIVSPLVRKTEPNCFMYIVQGVREIVKTDESPISIDYGDGTCDNLAEVTQDGITTIIELKHKRPNRE